MSAGASRWVVAAGLVVILGCVGVVLAVLVDSRSQGPAAPNGEQEAATACHHFVGRLFRVNLEFSREKAVSTAYDEYRVTGSVSTPDDTPAIPFVCEAVRGSGDEMQVVFLKGPGDYDARQKQSTGGPRHSA